MTAGDRVAGLLDSAPPPWRGTPWRWAAPRTPSCTSTCAALDERGSGL